MHHLSCELLENTQISSGIYRLRFRWNGEPPQSGQFFMLKPKRTAVFLGRPMSAAAWDAESVSFLTGLRGKGTADLTSLHPGEAAELTGPLGKPWNTFGVAARGGGIGDDCRRRGSYRRGIGDDCRRHGSYRRGVGDDCRRRGSHRRGVGDDCRRHGSHRRGVGSGARGVAGRVALIAGGLGIAPIAAFARELQETAPGGFDLYAGFGSAPFGLEGLEGLVKKIATEDGSFGKHGRILDFFDPSRYQAVYACGPEGMLKNLALRCREQRVPCFVSLERRMACGVGACLGCTVATSAGNRRCCTDGPVFNAEEVLFDE